jgi:hypothetical protein
VSDGASYRLAVFMVQCTGGDQWAARDAFLRAATKVFPK